jgi:hypothetical protein
MLASSWEKPSHPQPRSSRGLRPQDDPLLEHVRKPPWTLPRFRLGSSWEATHSRVSTRGPLYCPMVAGKIDLELIEVQTGGGPTIFQRSSERWVRCRLLAQENLLGLP